MSSKRLPGKTLADVEGEPMLSLMLRRVGGAREIERVVVATSDQAEDDRIAELAVAMGTAVHRGDRADVLGRIMDATHGHSGPVVRLTADCPLIDASVIDEVVLAFLDTPDCAYASNVEPRTFPDGLDVEVIDAAKLAETASTAVTRDDREHVTSAIRRSLGEIRSATVYCESDLSAVRWTVDDQNDLDFVRSVVARLGDDRHSASMARILSAVSAPPSLASFGGARRA
jgi:spore coat polysaccharide biosynthesis protein SpsF (cytidylyltransferase family)